MAAEAREPRSWPIARQWRADPDPLPPPLVGWVGGFRVLLHCWPPDVPPPHPEAVRPSTGPLAGYWCLWRVQ